MSKGYSMFLKHMFKPTIPKKKDKDNLKENGNQNEGELNEGELNEESRVFTENQQENDWEMKRSTINLKGVFEKRLFENKKSTVDLYSISGSNVVKKSTSDAQGMIEHINEAL